MILTFRDVAHLEMRFCFWEDANDSGLIIPLVGSYVRVRKEGESDPRAALPSLYIVVEIIHESDRHIAVMMKKSYGHETW